MSPRGLGLALVSREYPPFFGGGIGTYARWIVPALVNAGVRVHVITEAHDEMHPRVEVDGPVTVHRVPVWIGRGEWTGASARFSMSAGRVAAGLAARGEIDVAEFAECEGAGAALLMARGGRGGGGMPRVPVVVHLHTPSEMLFALRSLAVRGMDETRGACFLNERLALRLADRLCAPSRFIAEWARGHYDLPQTPTVIPYALGPVNEAPAASAAKNVLFVGRIEPRKGVEPLIHAWRAVLRRHPDARLRLAGADTGGAPEGGSLKLHLLSLLDQRERASVHFLGRLRPEELDPEYAWASVCVIPSLWENYPNTCIEALVNARPVVVSDHGGMIEMIEGADAGEAFRSGDVGSLTAALTTILDQSAERRAARGMAGRSAILHRCDPARVAAARIELFHDTIRACGDGPRSSGAGQGVLAEWRRCEALLRGRTDAMGLPVLDGEIAPWIERGSGVGAAP